MLPWSWTYFILGIYLLFPKTYTLLFDYFLINWFLITKTSMALIWSKLLRWLKKIFSKFYVEIVFVNRGCFINQDCIIDAVKAWNYRTIQVPQFKSDSTQIFSKPKEWEERVHLVTRSERVPHIEERGRNESTLFRKERSRNKQSAQKELFVLFSLLFA